MLNFVKVRRAKKKLLLILLSVPLVGISWLLVDQYVFCPTFSFPATKPFSGNNIYNPYQDIDSIDVVVGNFHAHSRIWKGLTNGVGDASDIWRRYDSMGYRFHAVSQYHYIDSFEQNAVNYIGAYEHGLNLKKTHQLVLGAKHVVWKDYFFPQTIDNKQQIIEKIAEDPNVIIVLNHPGMRNGYKANDFKKLFNYDFIEILNPQAQSFAQWDSALSNGHAVFGLADDDVHDVFNNEIIGRYYNIIYSSHGSKEGLINALRKGSAISVWAPEIKTQSLEDKKNKIEENKKILQSVYFIRDSLSLQFSKKMDTVKLIGNHGKLIKSEHAVASFSYKLLSDDSYVRVEYVSYDGTRFYMNPFFRF